MVKLILVHFRNGHSIPVASDDTVNDDSLGLMCEMLMQNHGIAATLASRINDDFDYEDDCTDFTEENVERVDYLTLPGYDEATSHLAVIGREELGTTH